MLSETTPNFVRFSLHADPAGRTVGEVLGAPLAWRSTAICC